MSKSVENEHFCMEFARELGLPTAKTTIVDFSDQRVLVAERFDRQWTRDKRLLRLPQEDTSLLRPTDSQVSNRRRAWY